MRILIACEFSGVVRDAFAALGHDAWSCDLDPTERPGQHITADVLDHLDESWDMMIAFPPCQYLTRAAARYWANPTWREHQVAAGEFARQLWQAPIHKIAIENPPGRLPEFLGRFHQTIQPWQFGHGFTKLTCLWLKNLPPLIDSIQATQRESWTKKNSAKSKQRPRRRSRTFPGIAAAMAAQWG